VKGVASLLRLARYEVDERQRELAAARDARAALDHEEAALNQYVATEAAAAGQSTLAMAGYAGFLQRIAMMRVDLKQRKYVADRHIEIARDALNAAFLEQKRIETLADKLKQERVEAEAAREDAERDEAVLIRRAREAGASSAKL
jgi:flagellar protein FliJ